MTPPDEDLQALGRHALALTIWLTAGVIAAPLYHFVLGVGGPAFLASAFGVVAAGFVGHVIVNVVFSRDFTTRELALGLVVFAVALVGFGLATLVSADFAARAFLATRLGFLGLTAGFVFYLVTKSGVQPAFDSFDVIRSFRARDAASKENRQ